VATSLIAYVESRAALSRRRHAGDLSLTDYRRLLHDLEADWERYVRIEITEGLVREAARVAETHGLRAYDAIHLASAMLLRERMGEDTMFASWDRNLDVAAAHEGFQLLRPRQR
jgi:predicted nucleic acid-binding protein